VTVAPGQGVLEGFRQMTDVQTRTESTTCPRHKPGTPRRAVFAGAGALGAACLLAACGTDTQPNNGGANGSGFTNDPAPAGSLGPNGQPATGGGDTGGGTSLAKVADIPEGGGAIKGDLVITQPKAGEFKAFSKVCTHQGCDVNGIANGVIICPCHRSEFSIEDGSPQSGPARQALPETKVKVDGDDIVAA
jgi:Rieske Fe-S protein